mmetsp:Transcript_5778/g.22852  ORF Transcript_5778/g.22852 Transcript_5778/m.22852 type:complete len:288 (+) Transcript_5778:261-1124(+)
MLRCRTGCGPAHRLHVTGEVEALALCAEEAHDSPAKLHCGPLVDALNAAKEPLPLSGRRFVNHDSRSEPRLGAAAGAGRAGHISARVNAFGRGSHLGDRLGSCLAEYGFGGNAALVCKALAQAQDLPHEDLFCRAGGNRGGARCSRSFGNLFDDLEDSIAVLVGLHLSDAIHGEQLVQVVGPRSANAGDRRIGEDAVGRQRFPCLRIPRLLDYTPTPVLERFEKLRLPAGRRKGLRARLVVTAGQRLLGPQQLVARDDSHSGVWVAKNRTAFSCQHGLVVRALTVGN